MGLVHLRLPGLPPFRVPRRALPAARAGWLQEANRLPPSVRRHPTESRKSAPDALSKLHPCTCETATVHTLKFYGALEKFYGALCKAHRSSFQSAPLRLHPSPPRVGPGHLGREGRGRVAKQDIRDDYAAGRWLCREGWEGREGFYHGKTRKRASRGTEVVDEMER